MGIVVFQVCFLSIPGSVADNDNLLVNAIFIRGKILMFSSNFQAVSSSVFRQP